MRYFLTGATGFLGGELARQLRAASHDVIALVRSPEKAGPLREIGVHIAQGDITDHASLHDPMKGCDGVFHCAAWYAVGTDSSRAHAINVGGTRNVLETMRDLGIPKGVYTSTLGVNSDTKGAIRDESYRYEGGDFLSVYEETKWRAHYEVAIPMMKAGLPLVIVNPGIIYGPGDTSQLGQILKDAIRGKPVALPDEPSGGCWSHVEDVAQAHILAMEKGTAGETYNINGPIHTFKEAVRTAAKVGDAKLRAMWVPPTVLRVMAPVMDVIGSVIPLPTEMAGETLRASAGVTYFGDNSKARRDLGYDPRPIDTGFRQTFGGA
ncbi:MAG: NAD-dependent epimerase/dehydratase family protein [Rhodothermales bacterium]|nr:NAD-dependent epimerase/dehydratase family protein [Rhodothermales bacterium]MBO6780769.1 NAD-dependent epimerase/dehydratase family protein [Rhodothermales bacterium]